MYDPCQEGTITVGMKRSFRGFDGFPAERALQTCVGLSLVLAQQDFGQTPSVLFIVEQ